MSQSKVQHIFRVFDALNLVKGIKAVGGPDHQTYYIESDVYAPDRRITPLILQPYVEVSDPNGVIPSGDKVGELSSASWYIGEAILANKITAKESEATLDTPFAIGENNALHVRRNSTKSILLIFEGEYLDIRKDKNIHISLTYTLTTTSNTEVKPAPKLILSKPQSWKYCPLENQTKAVIEATVSQDSKLYQSAVQWVKVEGDKETLIGEDDPFYIEGQNTDKLTINPSLMASTLIRAKNHDEVFYNKVYGINPEWDHRMDEVMRNRNLITKASYSNLGYINGDIFTRDGSSGCIVIPLTKDKVYSLFVYKHTGNRFAVSLFPNLENGSKAIQTLFKRINTSLDKAEKWEGIKVLQDCFLVIYYNYGPNLSAIDLKVEEGSVATPYTPAPEDLNWCNNVINSNFEKGLNFWSASETWSEIVFNNTHPKTAINTWNTTGAVLVNNNIIINVNAGDYYLITALVKNNQKEKSIMTLGFSSPESHTSFEVGNPLTIDKNSWHLISDIVQISERSKNTQRRFSYRVLSDSNLLISDIFCSKINIQSDSIQMLLEGPKCSLWTLSPYDITPDGILKGTYQSDIKFTRYFPKLETEIDFLTGDTLRAGMDTVKMKAVFKTNKEEIKNPEQYFDIKWYLDPVEAGGKAEYLGQGESLEVPISKIPLKARAIPFRLEYEFK